MSIPFKKLFEIKESKGLFEIKAKVIYIHRNQWKIWVRDKVKELRYT